MKSMMHGHERRRKRRITLMVIIIAVPLLAVGVWLLFFNDGHQRQAAVKPSPSAMVETAEPVATPAESVLGVSTSEVLPPSAIDKDDWRLILINAQHSLPDGLEVKLTTLKNEQAADERCYPDLQQMLDDCRTAGLEPLICSSYRSAEKQQQLFDNKVKSFTDQGYSDEEARNLASKSIAIPGTSEHQTGLAFDIVDTNNQNLDESQENTPVQQWLMKNCTQYGFVLRYPKDKVSVTGITNEPWHYRYVGKEAAQVMQEKGLCLEEYLEQFA